MFDLWRLERDRRRIVSAHGDDLRKLKLKKATPEEFEELRHAQWADLQVEDDGINRFLSDQLWEEARKYDVAIPVGEGVWEDSIFGDRKYMAMATRANVRRLIDEVKARRFEVRTLWITKIILPLAGLLIGIIGALTGLFAVIHKSPAAPEKKTPVYEVPIQVKAQKK
jgi:hypothetical protein